jgi:hypothetical protein
MGKLSLQEQADRLIEQAEKKGVSTNFFFRTTFKRYQVQMRILQELEVAISEHGTTVKKEYVKGRENIVINPAITEYNKTTTAANNTVQTLVKIIQGLGDDAGGSKLQDLINSLGDE